AIGKAMDDALAVLLRLVGEVRDCAIPRDDDRTVSNAEIYAYHEKFATEHPEQYQAETLRRIRAAAGISQEKYLEKKAELEQMRAAAASIFADVDLLVMPTVPISPPEIEALQNAGANLRSVELMMLRNTRPFNI